MLVIFTVLSGAYLVNQNSHYTVEYVGLAIFLWSLLFMSGGGGESEERYDISCCVHCKY